MKIEAGKKIVMNKYLRYIVLLIGMFAILITILGFLFLNNSKENQEYVDGIVVEVQSNSFESRCIVEYIYEEVAYRTTTIKTQENYCGEGSVVRVYFKSDQPDEASTTSPSELRNIYFIFGWFAVAFFTLFFISKSPSNAIDIQQNTSRSETEVNAEYPQKHAGSNKEYVSENHKHIVNIVNKVALAFSVLVILILVVVFLAPSPVDESSLESRKLAETEAVILIDDVALKIPIPENASTSCDSLFTDEKLNSTCIIFNNDSHPRQVMMTFKLVPFDNLYEHNRLPIYSRTAEEINSLYEYIGNIDEHGKFATLEAEDIFKPFAVSSSGDVSIISLTTLKADNIELRGLLSQLHVYGSFPDWPAQDDWSFRSLLEYNNEKYILSGILYFYDYEFYEYLDSLEIKYSASNNLDAQGIEWYTDTPEGKQYVMELYDYVPTERHIQMQKQLFLDLFNQIGLAQ